MECAFGEIDQRWGIFWSAIQYSLENTCIICEGAMHLHNFLVDCRNSLSEPLTEVQKENEIFHYDQIDNGIVSYAITNDSTRPRGRPSFDEVECRQKVCFSEII